jgi:hypothetical protein
MRRLLSILAALVFAVAQPATVRADFIVNQYLGFHVASAAGPFSLEYLTAIQWTSGTTISGAVDIGAADASKEIFITAMVVETGGGGTPTLDAATTTVDGVASTKCTTFVGTTAQEIACAFAAVPTSAGSVTVTATYNLTLLSGRICVYKVLNRPGIGNNETDADQASTTGTSLALSLNTIPANGFWLAMHRHANTNATTSPTGPAVDSDVSAASARWNCTSRGIGVEAGTTPTDTWSWTGSVAARQASWSFD